MLVLCAAAETNAIASTRSSRRCEHIFLPRLPLNSLQEMVPPSVCIRYAERSDRGRGNVGSTIRGTTSGAEVLS